MYIPVHSYKVKVMFDTGATRTLMSRRLHQAFCSHGFMLPLEPSSVQLAGVAGQRLQIDGRVSFPFTFGPITIQHPVIVVANMRDTVIIGNDLMDNRITLHEGRSVTVKDQGEELQLPLCRALPGIKLTSLKNEEVGPGDVKLIMCKCGISPDDPQGDAVLIAGVTPGGTHIPELVSRIADDGTIHVIAENRTDAILVVNEGEEVGEAIPLRKTLVEGRGAFEPVPEPEVIGFLHDKKLRDDVLLGMTDGVLPLPTGYDEDEVRPRTKINVGVFKTPGLNEEQRQKLLGILERFRGVFSTGSGDYGKTPLMSFTIKTGNAEPYAARYYPIPAAYKAVVSQQVKQMQRDGIVEDANSPWSSNLVIVKKPNGKLRICANLKGVNALTQRTTSFPINFQEESLAKLCNGVYFFRIDLSQAYYSIPIDDPVHRDKTAFYTSGGQKRFRVSPFGAKYLPSQFNFLMLKILHDIDDQLFYYFDDVIGAYRTIEELLRGLSEVLFRLL